MNTTATLVLSAAAGLALFAGGCLERDETITVRSDGTTDLESEFRGDLEDMNRGDALPLAGGMWQVSQWETKTPSGGTDHVRRGTVSVAPGGALPESYAGAGDAASLRFPTTVTRELRGGDTFVHFSRVYRARVFAPYSVAQRALEHDGRTSELLKADPQTLTDLDRVSLLESFRRVELEKQAWQVRAAANALTDRPQDLRLRVMDGALSRARSYDLADATKLMAMPQSEERDAALAAIAEDFLSIVSKDLSGALDRENLRPEELAAATAAFELERARREVTEDLRDERWEVRLSLPGEIVAHNADEVREGTLVWTFDGNALLDADRELLATSRIASPTAP
ncbi:MAG: hypothetical protein WAZ94_12290 [Phycisphaerales bacterium]